MVNRSETIDVADGLSFIEIYGGVCDSALLIGGRPIAFNWDDGEGTVAQYLVRAGQINCEEELRELRQTLEGAWRDDIAIRDQILPIIKLLAPGRYTITINGAVPCHYEEYQSNWDPCTDYAGGYPHNSVLVFTQPSDRLDQKRIEDYRTMIQAGARPIALTIETSFYSYVLDGHHKLKASSLSEVRPAVINLLRENAPEISVESFANSIGVEHPLAEHYLAAKSWDLD